MNDKDEHPQTIELSQNPHRPRCIALAGLEGRQKAPVARGWNLPGTPPRHKPMNCAAPPYQKQKPVIRIFAVYEHDLNRNRTQLMLEELTRRLDRSFNYSVSWWSLKSFWHPKMRRVAADAIAKADLTLLAL